MPPAKRVLELDGLRGLLALYVAAFHLSAPLVKSGSALAWLAPWLHGAWFAVDVFFVMSGFVLMHVYGGTLRSTDRGATQRFLVARAARLVPVNLAALVAMLLILLVISRDDAQFLQPGGRYWWRAGVASALLLQSPWMSYRAWDYPAWSVSAECHAYLLFPLLAVTMAKLRTRTASVLVLLCTLATLGLYLSGTPQMDLERFPTNGPIVLLRALPLFIAGMACYSLWRTRLLARDWKALALCVALIALLRAPAAAPFAVLGAPLLVLMALQATGARAILSSRFAVALGTISYSLYMTHALVEVFLIGGVLHWTHSALRLDVTRSAVLECALLVGGLGAALWLAHLTWRYVEAPARRWLTRPAIDASLSSAPVPARPV